MITLTSITAAIAALLALLLVNEHQKNKEKANHIKTKKCPRRSNGQYKRKIPVKKGDKVLYYIYL